MLKRCQGIENLLKNSLGNPSEGMATLKAKKFLANTL
jgi:hypothetical protein